MTDTNTGADQSATEDFAAFEAKLDESGTYVVADLPKDEPTNETREAPADDAGAQDEPKVEGEQPKAKKTAQERINELTWRANEAERREKAAQERLEAALAGKTTTPAAEPHHEDDAPNPNDYEHGELDVAYIRDVTRYDTRKEIEASRQQDEAKRTLDAKLQTFDQRKTEAFKDGVPEGFTAFCALQTVPTALNDIIMLSDVGPQLAAHYGDKPAELARLSDMAPHLQAYEIAKVEATLSGAKAPATTTTSPKVVTTAPEPAPSLRGQGGKFKVAPDTDDFGAFDSAYS